MGLRVESVCVVRDEAVVLRDIVLSVRPGEVACLLGPSGCGKTTLLRVVAGLEPLQCGRISIGDRVVADADRRFCVAPEVRRVGLMFQDFALFPHLTVRANVGFGLRPGDRARRDWATAAMTRVGLDGLADRYPHTLSGGEQQRVALVRALAPGPDLLLLDEPFSGLDVTLRAQVRSDTLALVRDAGAATLLVTHDPDEATEVGDRLWLMADGAIVQSGSAEDIYRRPRNAFVAGLFGPLNRFEGVVRDGTVKTVLGQFEAGAVADGRPAQVLIRQEAIALGDGPQDRPARVLESRRHGSVRFLTLALEGRTDPIAAQVMALPAVAAGEIIRIRVDPRLVYVFARPESS